MSSYINTQAYFFKTFFSVINAANCQYVVLHSWQTLPEIAISDVDMLISGDEKGRLPLLLKQVEKTSGWRFVQKLWYDVPWCFYYVAVSPNGLSSVALDFISDPDGLGEYRIKDSIILAHREFSGFLYHLSTEAELAYKLAKRRVKGIFSDLDAKFVKDYYKHSDLVVLRNHMLEIMPAKVTDEMLAIFKKDWCTEDMRGFMETHTPAFILFGRRWHIKVGITWFIYTIKRILNRLKNPTGVLIYLRNRNIANRLIFPSFVFRREKIIQSTKVTFKMKISALASATVLKIIGCADEGFDIGYGFRDFSDNDFSNTILDSMWDRTPL